MNKCVDRKQLMFHLNLCDDQVIQKDQIVTERLFCVAILNQGTDIAAKILKEYNELKEIVNEVK